MSKGLKAGAVLIALVMAVFALTSCTKDAGEVFTLYSTETLKIDRQGAETRVYDLAGDAAYTFTTHRVRADKGAAAQIGEASTTADTETIRLQTVHGLIIVTDKTTGTTLYVKGAQI